MDQKQREKIEGEMPYGGFGSGMGGPPPKGCMPYFTWAVVAVLLIAAWFLLR